MFTAFHFLARVQSKLLYLGIKQELVGKVSKKYTSFTFPFPSTICCAYSIHFFFVEKKRKDRKQESTLREYSTIVKPLKLMKNGLKKR